MIVKPFDEPEPTILNPELLARILDRPIAFHPVFVDLAGSVAAALMLSQALYWTRRTKDTEGWFYKTQEEWFEETGMRRNEQERARRQLRSTSFWLEERRGVPGKLYYRVNLIALAEALAGAVQPVTLEQVLEIDAAALRGLSRAGHMRAVKAGVQAEYVDYSLVLQKKGMICGICERPILRPVGQKRGFLTFDHIVTIVDGGSHTADNLQPAHAECNFAKCNNGQEISQSAYSKQSSLLTVSNQECLVEADKSVLPKQSTTEITTETTSETTNTLLFPADGEKQHKKGKKKSSAPRWKADELDLAICKACRIVAPWELLDPGTITTIRKANAFLRTEYPQKGVIELEKEVRAWELWERGEQYAYKENRNPLRPQALIKDWGDFLKFREDSKASRHPVGGLAYQPYEKEKVS